MRNPWKKRLRPLFSWASWGLCLDVGNAPGMQMKNIKIFIYI
jgi:hypothetical protein